jgi:flagellar basal-body rod modification protein FlgD
MTTTPTSSNTTPNTSTTNTSNSNSSSNNNSLNQLASNFNDFLTLLTTQLQNQDPLDPMDTNQFTQQLVEFTGVQQQVDMNSNMQTLISLQQTSEATSAMQYLGSSVTLTGSTATLASGSSATWSLNSPSPATGNVTITNSSGQTVYTGTVSLNTGTQSYSWNGQGTNGVTYPAGQYTLALSATGATGSPVTVSTAIEGTVSGINLSQSPPEVTVSGQNYPITAIQSINSSSGSTLSNLNTTLSNLNTSLSTLSQYL